MNTISNSQDKGSEKIFSIVVSVYNKVNYLERMMSSVLSQSFLNFELILIDACSTDGSYEYLEKFNDPRIVLIKQPNMGVSVAKNYGVFVSSGKYITFLDADDYWEKGFLEEIVRLLSKYHGYEAYITGYKRIWKNHTDIVQYENKCADGIANDYFKNRVNGGGVHTSSVVVTKDIFNRVGGFPFLLGSRIVGKSWLVNCNGEILSEISSYSLHSRSVGLNRSFLLIPQPLESIVDLKLALPDIPGEDQFMHDSVALVSDFIYSSKILSNWDGDVSNQMTSIKRTPVIYPHLFAMCTVLSSNKYKVCQSHLKNYVKYLTVSFLQKVKQLPSADRKIIIRFHGLHAVGINSYLGLFVTSYLTKIKLRIRRISIKLSPKV